MLIQAISVISIVLKTKNLVMGPDSVVSGEVHCSCTLPFDKRNDFKFVIAFASKGKNFIKHLELAERGNSPFREVSGVGRILVRGNTWPPKGYHAPTAGVPGAKGPTDGSEV